MEIRQFAEDALTIQMGEEIDVEINRKLVALRRHIEDMGHAGIREIVLSYTSLIVYFDVFTSEAGALMAALRDIDEAALLEEGIEYKVIEIPVCYGGAYGPDLGNFEETGLSEQEVIDLHANKEYLVYMLGFMPGFPYLGGLDERLHKARLETPRVQIPAGSVGIGGKQTGMYPFESPGGWHLLGRTPVPLYDPRREPAILYAAGDRIIYRPIDEAEYERIEKAAASGDYAVEYEMKGGGC